MSIITISGIHIDFPNRPDPSQVEVEYVLNWLRRERITNRMAHWMRQQPTTPPHSTFQAKLLEVDAAFAWSDADDDAVDREARVIAEATITTRLAQMNLPPPANLAPHIDQLLSTNPNIRVVAQQRVLARMTAAQEILGESQP